MHAQRVRSCVVSLVLCLGPGIPSALWGAAFDSGSTGVYGPMTITSNTSLPLPADGVFHCTTVSVASGVTLTFARHAKNTPVCILATGDIVVEGTISVSGESPTGVAGGSGGAAAFDGGNAALGDQPAQSGSGPGGGRTDATRIGAAYATLPAGLPQGQQVQVYGNRLLFPLVGGSGGAGRASRSGGGGGGALLLASNTAIVVRGSVQALGGNSSYDGWYHTYEAGGGSGGALRLIAPSVTGTGSLNASGGNGTDGSGGLGWVRVDSHDSRDPASLSISGTKSFGTVMFVNPFPAPTLRITEAAGQTIPDSQDGVVTVVVRQADAGAAAPTVKLRATGFDAQINAKLVLIPESTGLPVAYDVIIDNRAGTPTEVTVPDVDFPLNVTVSVQAWTTP